MHSFSWTDLEEKIPWILNDKMYCLHSGGNFVFFAFNLKAFKWYDCKRKTTNNNQCILFSVLFNFPSFKRIQFCYSHKMIWTNGSKKNRVQFFINFNFFRICVVWESFDASNLLTKREAHFLSFSLSIPTSKCTRGTRNVCRRRSLGTLTLKQWHKQK